MVKFSPAPPSIFEAVPYKVVNCWIAPPVAISMVTRPDCPKPNLNEKPSREALAWKSFGTIGYDTYLNWVLASSQLNSTPVDIQVELEPKMV